MNRDVTRSHFKFRVQHWAEKLEVRAHTIYIRPMTRKWASCSTAGTLSFNDELLDLPKELRDYVIVHELLHFSVPNHGKLWRSLMRAHLGEWETLAESLPKIAAKAVSARAASSQKKPPRNVPASPSPSKQGR